MRRLAPIALAGAFLAGPAEAQAPTAGAALSPAPGTIFPTNGVQTCGPITQTLASLNATMALTCGGAASYIITAVTTNGQTPLIGSLTSTDSVTGGNRLLFKTGVGPLDVSTVAMTGVQGLLEYRTVGGGQGQRITLSSYTSGSVDVTIFGSYNPALIFTNNSAHSAEEAALRNGKAFSASTGVQSVTVNQYLSMVLSNPANSGQRAIITERSVGCNNPTGNVPSQYYTLSNPSVNLPATPVTISNRKTGGATSVLSSTYTASATTFPDTSPTTPLTSRIGGFVPSGGMTGGPGMTERTLEPGNSTAFSVLGVTNGLGTTPSCIINVVWYEENIN